MKKTSIALVATLAMLLCTQIALADTLTMPDPTGMGFDITLHQNKDNQFSNSRSYKASNQGIVRDVVLTYIEKLMQFEQLAYVQCITDSNGWVYHILDAAEGFTYADFLWSTDDWKTKNACVAICYHPQSLFVEFHYSPDFTLPFDAFTPTPKPTAKPCSECDGTGKCKECGGDMWVTEWEWIYVNGSPVSQQVTKLCDGVYCYGGACLKCWDD